MVILNKLDYIKEGHRQPADTSFYKELQGDLATDYESQITTTLSQLKQLGKITSEILNRIKPTHSRPGRFYLLPKIHKLNNPGRPIVSGLNTVTENISGLVDSLMKDIPPNFPSYLKDTNHFLQEISQLCIPTGSFLVTLDVTSLYTSIPHGEGIEAVGKAYSEGFHKYDIDSSTISTLTRLVLELNHFEFEDKLPTGQRDGHGHNNGPELR